MAACTFLECRLEGWALSESKSYNRIKHLLDEPAMEALSRLSTDSSSCGVGFKTGAATRAGVLSSIDRDY